MFIVLEGRKEGAFLFEKLKKETKKTTERLSFLSLSLLPYNHDPHFCRYSDVFLCVENISCGLYPHALALPLYPIYASRGRVEPQRISRRLYSRCYPLGDQRWIERRAGILLRHSLRNCYSPYDERAVSRILFLEIGAHAKTVAGRVKIKDNKTRFLSQLLHVEKKPMQTRKESLLI